MKISTKSKYKTVKKVHKIIIAVLCLLITAQSSISWKNWAALNACFRSNYTVLTWWCHPGRVLLPASGQFVGRGLATRLHDGSNQEHYTSDVSGHDVRRGGCGSWITIRLIKADVFRSRIVIFGRGRVSNILTKVTFLQMYTYNVMYFYWFTKLITTYHSTWRYASLPRKYLGDIILTWKIALGFAVK